MPSVSFYFKIHQPERLKNYSVFDIGNSDDYFDDEKNKFYLDRIVEKCYVPTLELIKELIYETDGRFKASFGITGIFLEQLLRWHPEVIGLFQDLAKTNSIEFTGETYYHSLASLYSVEEFKNQVLEHKRLIKELFLKEPKVFSNTELIYFDDLAKVVNELGFDGIITEGAERILGWRSPNYVYNTPCNYLKVILRNFKLSDDMSFRFSSRDWSEYPLTTNKFASWLESLNGGGEVVGLFMDFETFGEHQWQETGIFDFLANLPNEVLRKKDLEFSTLSEVIKKYPSRGEFSSKYPVTWADTERDLSAWLANQMQKDSAQMIYSFEKKCKMNIVKK